MQVRSWESQIPARSLEVTPFRDSSMSAAAYRELKHVRSRKSVTKAG